MVSVSNELAGVPAGMVSNAEWNDVRFRITGEVLRAGDSGYDESRAIWNAMIDRRPAGIVLVESAEDVSQAVRFATEHGLQLSVRGCGHNIAGTAVTDGGLMISFTRMKGVQVDAGSRRVRVQAGADWAVVDSATEPFGLVVPGGIVSTTGVSGFTLGGGFGWLTRKYGFTSDSLRRATVVLADGSIREASLESEPELFWAIRGGGGNFGVVTEFEFEAQQLGPEIVGGMLLWPIDQMQDVTELFRRVTSSAPSELVHVLFTRTAPAAPFLPETIHGKPVVGIAACFAGLVEDGLQALQPVKAFGKPLVDTIKPKSFREHQAFLDAGQPYGRRYYWKSVYLPEFNNRAQDALLAKATSFTSPFSSVLIPHLGGIPNPPDGAASAVSFRNAEYLVNYQGSWENPAEDELHMSWARDNFEAMAPNAIGQYVNFMTEDEVTDTARAAYDEQSLTRLSQIKRHYDPENIFRLNKNIEPAG